MRSTMIVTDEAYRLECKPFSVQPGSISGLHASKRDKAAFQLVVNSDGPYSLAVNRQYWVGRTRVKEGPQRQLRVEIRCALQANMQLEEFVEDDDGTLKADILLGDPVRESRANWPSAVYCEIDIPESAQAGEYPIEILLYGALDQQDEALLQCEALTLHVADYALPAPRDWKFTLDLWQDSSNVARQHEAALWSDEHFSILRKYAATLAALGQKSITVIASEIPWRGQSCRANLKHGGNLFEYSMIGISRDKSGAYRFDYTAMQRYIDICTEEGICGDIEVIGLVNVWNEEHEGDKYLCEDYPEPIRLRYLDESDGCMKFVREREVVCEYVRSLERYFTETNQLSRVRIAADEPGDVEKYRKSLALLKELAPSFRCKTAINHAEFIEEFHDRIDDFSPFLACAVREYDRLRGYQAQYPDKKFLWYVCCGDTTPNTFIYSPPIESRMIGILTSFFRFDGFLRWAYACWPEDPRRDVRFDHFEAGDAFFVYPGKNGAPLLSLRYKNLQRGIADYELLEALRAKCGDEAADEMLRMVLKTDSVADFWREGGRLANGQLFSLNWQDYDAFKAAILAKLSA